MLFTLVQRIGCQLTVLSGDVHVAFWFVRGAIGGKNKRIFV